MSNLQTRNRRLLFVSGFFSAAALLLSTALSIIPGIESNPLPGVGLMYVQGSSAIPGSGVVIGPRHVLTAEHVIDDAPVSQYRFRVQGGSPVTPIAIYPHPSGFDIAVVEFGDAVTFTDSYGLYTGDDEVGKTITIAGFGFKGVALPNNPCGWTHDPLSYGTQRWGKNVVSHINGPSKQLRFDFDGGGWDYYQDGGPITNESGLAGGDSGGPSFITTDDGDLLVAGIHTNVEPGIHAGNPIDPPCYSPYSHGRVSVDSRVSAFAEWIQEIIN